MGEPGEVSRPPGPIGYYVHHHGAGHAARYSKINDASERLLVPISELDLTGGVRLPSDVVDEGDDPSAGGGLHWAPVGDPQSADRALIFGSWMSDVRPSGVVVDVSVEAALLCRLFGVPTIAVRQHGDRTDPAHEMAYRSALALLAPFPVELEHRSTPSWVRDKTLYCGFIAARESPVMGFFGLAPQPRPGPDDLVVLWGAGGGRLTHEAVCGLVDVMRPNTVWFAGDADSSVRAAGAEILGWVDDVASLLSERPVVLGSAGNNVVADAAAAGCALIVAPQQRPFDEQVRHAQSLDAAGAAAVADLEQPDWVRTIDKARSRQHVLAALSQGGASAAATAISQTFEHKSPRHSPNALAVSGY